MTFGEQLSAKKSSPTSRLKQEPSKKAKGFAGEKTENRASGKRKNKETPEPKKFVLLEHIKGFIIGFFDAGNFKETHEIASFGYDFSYWLCTTNQTFALTNILSKTQSDLANYIKKGMIKSEENKSEITAEIDGIPLNHTQIEIIAESLDLLQMFQNILTKGLEIEARVYLYAWQKKDEMFKINKDDDEETNIKKTDLIGFTNNRLALYTVASTMVAMIIAYIVNTSLDKRKMLDLNEPGFPLMLKYFIEEGNSTVLRSKIISLAAYHRLYLEIFTKLEDYDSFEPYLEDINELKANFDRGAQTFNEFKFPFDNFSSNTSAAKDRNTANMLNLIAKLGIEELDNDKLKPKELQQERVENQEKIRQEASLYSHSHLHSNAHGLLLLLVDLLFKPNQKLPLENIGPKVHAAYGSFLFPLIKKLESKRAEIEKKSNKDPKIENGVDISIREKQDLAFLGSNLHLDLGSISNDYSLPKYVAILHEVRYNLGINQTLDLLDRLSLIKPQYRSINLNNEKIREFWLKSINSQITAIIDNHWSSVNENKIPNKVLNLIKSEIQNFALLTDQDEVRSLISDLEKSPLIGASPISDGIYDLLEYLEAQTNLVLCYKFDGLSYAHNRINQLNRYLDIKELIQNNNLAAPIAKNNRDGNDSEHGFNLSDTWSRLILQHSNVLFPADNPYLSDRIAKKRSFEKSLMSSDLENNNKKTTAKKLMYILEDAAIKITTKGIEETIAHFKGFYKSETRPINGTKALIIDISAADRLILDFNLLEKGILAPIFAGDPHNKNWY